MSIQDESGANRPLVSPAYYEQGARWEQDIYRKTELSRNAWRIVSGLLGVAVIGCIWALIALLPLKSF